MEHILRTYIRNTMYYVHNAGINGKRLPVRASLIDCHPKKPRAVCVVGRLGEGQAKAKSFRLSGLTGRDAQPWERLMSTQCFSTLSLWLKSTIFASFASAERITSKNRGRVICTSASVLEVDGEQLQKELACVGRDAGNQLTSSCPPVLSNRRRR